jgi:hypothetical protein
MQPDTYSEPTLWQIVLRAPIPHLLESVAITFCFCLLQTMAIFGLRLDAWFHEMVNFLKHYEVASQEQRLPVHVVIAAMFTLNLIVVVIARRHREITSHGE